MSIESAPAGEVSPRADLISALVWAVFGAAVAVGAWRMDRLENLHINKYEVPGLVPGLLGLAMLALAIVLAVRSLRRGALAPRGEVAQGNNGDRAYMAGVVGVMLLYPLVLVGRGVPFWLATLVFVAAFIFLFDRERQRALGRTTARQVLLAFVYGAATSALVTSVFQNVFYVRLP